MCLDVVVSRIAPPRQCSLHAPQLASARSRLTITSCSPLKNLLAILGTARVDAVTVPTACLSSPRLLVFDGGKDHRERVSSKLTCTAESESVMLKADSRNTSFSCRLLRRSDYCCAMCRFYYYTSDLRSYRTDSLTTGTR